MKISDLIANFLAEKGIRHVFGIVGAGNAHLFDSITSKGFTSIICVHHEQAACMAAQAYYRICGRLSAAIVTTGAGSTNAVTGVVSAWMDSIPFLIISGNENSKYTLDTNPLRVWGVQGYDSVAMVSKVTKYATRVLNPNETLPALEAAYYYALHAKQGPCWIDFPMNIQAMQLKDVKLSQFESSLIATNHSAGRILQANELHQAVSAVWNELTKAQRPVIWLGHGIRSAGAVDLVEPFINSLQCPVLISWAGIDIVSSDHPLVFGRAGVYGQRAANFILQNCDFLLAIGTRLAIPQIGYDLNEFIRTASLALVDIDLAEIKKYGEKVTIPIHADAKDFMQTLLAMSQSHPIINKKIWLSQCEKYRRQYPILSHEYHDQEGYINSYTFINKLSDYFTANQIIVTDMGTALLSTHQIVSIKKGQRLMTSTGLGEMGYALPAAIGAAFANKNAEIICLNCDGGMMLNLQELQTIIHHNLPIKIFVFNNDGYLMIKHTQKALFSGRYAGTNKQSGVSCPDFSAIAQAFAIPSFVIRTWKEVESEIPKVQNLAGPVICEVFTHPEQLFSPKLSLALQKDGTLVSPPLEDLSPLLPREELRENMLIGLHPKSEAIEIKAEVRDTSVCN